MIGRDVEFKGDEELTGEEVRLFDFGVESLTFAGEAGTDCDLALTNSISFFLRPAHFSLFIGISSSSSSSLVRLHYEQRGGGLSYTSMSSSGLCLFLGCCCG